MKIYHNKTFGFFLFVLCVFAFFTPIQSNAEAVRCQHSNGQINEIDRTICEAYGGTVLGPATTEEPPTEEPPTEEPPEAGGSNCTVNGRTYEDVSMAECNQLKQDANNTGGSCSIDDNDSQYGSKLDCESAGGSWTSSNANSDDLESNNSKYIPNVSKNSLSSYIKGVYVYAIGIVGILATIVIMIGGFIWISSMGNASRVNTAKEWIGGALTGLALAMFSYTILYIINQDLVNFQWQAPSSIETTSDKQPEETDFYEESGCCKPTNGSCRQSNDRNNCVGNFWSGKTCNTTTGLCE